MVNAKEIASFIDEHSKELNIKGNNFSWPEKYGFDLSDIGISFEIEDKIYNGRGTSSNGNLALVKAFSEAIEAYMISEKGLETTSGTSVHFNSDEGRKNARYELIERDLFLSNYLAGNGLSRINEIREVELFKTAESVLQKYDIQINCYELGVNGVCIVLNGLESKKAPFGVIIGTSYDEKLEVRVENALIECLRDAFSVIEGSSSNMPLEKFAELERVSPYDHLALARNLEYGKSIIDQFESTRKYHFFEIENNIEIEECELAGIFSKLSLKFFHARSDKHQKLFFGQTTDDRINLKRINQDININLSDIVRRPHPFG